MNWRRETNPTLHKRHTQNAVQLNSGSNTSVKLFRRNKALVRIVLIRFYINSVHHFRVQWNRKLLLLLLNALKSHLLWNVLLSHFLQHILQLWITNVHQHVGIGTVFHCHIHVIIMATIVVINCLLFCASRYHIIIKFAPLKFTRYTSDFTFYTSATLQNI